MRLPYSVTKERERSNPSRGEKLIYRVGAGVVTFIYGMIIKTETDA